MADIVYNGLLHIDAATIAAAEKSHMLVAVSSSAGPDGRVPINVSDLKENYAILKPLLSHLAGKQPTSANYAAGMHMLDKATHGP
jgi:hypothetical protein